MSFLQAGELSSCFELHMSTFGRLDICINNAGIGEKEFFTEDRSTDGQGSWRRVVDVNYVSVIDGTRLAVRSLNNVHLLITLVILSLLCVYYVEANASIVSGLVQLRCGLQDFCFALLVLKMRSSVCCR